MYETTAQDVFIAIQVLETYERLLETPKGVGPRIVVGVVRGALKVVLDALRELVAGRDDEPINPRAFYETPELLDNFVDVAEAQVARGELDHEAYEELSRSADIFADMCGQAADAFEDHVYKVREQAVVDDRFEELIEHMREDKK